MLPVLRGDSWPVLPGRAAKLKEEEVRDFFLHLVWDRQGVPVGHPDHLPEERAQVRGLPHRRRCRESSPLMADTVLL